MFRHLGDVFLDPGELSHIAGPYRQLGGSGHRLVQLDLDQLQLGLSGVGDGIEPLGRGQLRLERAG